MRFNGTVEWALDSIGQTRWSGCRARTSCATRSATGSSGWSGSRDPAGGYAVVLVDGARYVDIDAERAYARALLAVLPS